MVRAGTALTFVVAGRTAGLFPVNAGDVRNDVINRLIPFCTVDNVIINKPALGEIVDPSQWFHWDYTATVMLRPKADYGTADDVGSIIANAFYQAAGAVPTVTQGTTIVPPIGQWGTTISDVVDSITFSSPVMLAVLLVGGLALLVAYGPNLKGIGKVSLT